MILSFRINECGRPEQEPWRDAGMGLQDGESGFARWDCIQGLWRLGFDERTMDYGIAFIRDFMVFRNPSASWACGVSCIDCNVMVHGRGSEVPELSGLWEI